MDKLTIAFIGLLTVLLVGQWLFTESFVDVSDNSGTMITLSLKDLLSLFSSSRSSSSTTPSTPTSTTTTTSLLDSTEYKDLLGDVKKTVQDELLASAQKGGLLSGSGSQGEQSSDTVLTDSCMDSFSSQQGADFLKYVPGKNPNDYIRKDSIPCYGCTI